MYDAYFAAKAEGKRGEELNDAIRAAIVEWSAAHEGMRATMPIREQKAVVQDAKAREKDLKKAKKAYEAALKARARVRRCCVVCRRVRHSFS